MSRFPAYEGRDAFTEGTYGRQVGGNVAIIPGMNEYTYPENGNVDNKIQFDKLLSSPARFNRMFRLSVADKIMTNADFANYRRDSTLEPTIANLLNADSNARPDLRYAPADFMHCRDSAIVSGYHMITLRRFAYPIDDNLMTARAASKKAASAFDVGRLVTYTTEEDNKLSELLTMSFGLNWKELTADFWTPEVIGPESGASGLLGTLMEFANPMYLASKGLGKNAINVDPQYDQNKVYGPVDSITKTHIRDRGLNFNHEINITFNYDLKAFDGANPRTAMLDLISNMLLVTFNDAKFWGGAIKWRGMQRGAFSHYLSVSDAMSVSKDFNSTVNYYKGQLQSLAGGKQGWQAVIELGKLLLKGLAGMALDKLIGTLGRPSVVVANSLLSGEPVGMWHLTIGNPFRPICSIGNLILTNSVLSFGDQLGHDGFPTTMKLVCTLKHAKPRSRAGIEMMFNQGQQRIYWQPDKAAFTKAVQKSHAYKGANAADIAGELTNEVYAYLDNTKLGNWFPAPGTKGQAMSERS